VELAETVVAIGNKHGPKPDKFDEYGLTAVEGTKVGAPLIAECYANFECRLVDAKLINKYSLFVFEVVKAHAATRPKFPTTIHYRGEGLFMVAGPTTSKWKKGFRPEML
jgi:flavin reductase (DIM6/NTAB) family NADH-FMN oxidoreductase RutF